MEVRSCKDPPVDLDHIVNQQRKEREAGTSTLEPIQNRIVSSEMQQESAAHRVLLLPEVITI